MPGPPSNLSTLPSQTGYSSRRYVAIPPTSPSSARLVRSPTTPPSPMIPPSPTTPFSFYQRRPASNPLGQAPVSGPSPLSPTTPPIHPIQPTPPIPPTTPAGSVL